MAITRVFSLTRRLNTVSTLTLPSHTAILHTKAAESTQHKAHRYIHFGITVYSYSGSHSLHHGRFITPIVIRGEGGL
ncbi:hypothetical protein E2C01_042765 [Portunus trituberculatus]|uniref:Uncharacterized protein n=1 Tax=Portunus trituberculatus TaxID=210409 RepID=A0A5B7FVP3_PORTR|nr:hypothetical protein [Portunus trituberculatus]